MKPTLLFYLLVLGAVATAQAQNMVTNGSFEGYTTCPSAISQLHLCSGWNTFTAASPDYYHSCSGSSTAGVPVNFGGTRSAASGVAYAGVIDKWSAGDYREYLHTDMSPMYAGARYDVSMSVSLADISAIGSDGMGIFFYDVGPTDISGSSYYTGITSVLPLTPQVSFNSAGPITKQDGWLRLSKVYVPDSAYDNIVIGGFNPISTMTTATANGPDPYSYYYIDSVVVKLLSPIIMTHNATALCAGDVLNISYTTNSNVTFAGNNVFTLQLSSSNGSFASATTLATISGTTSGTFSTNLPSSLTPGTAYRLRVVSSNPVDSSNFSAYPINIHLPFSINAYTNTPICEGDTLKLNANYSIGANYIWTGPNNYQFSGLNPKIPLADLSYNGNYIISGSRGGCYAKDTVTAVIHPTPVVAAGGDPIACEGQPFHLTATSTLPGASFVWAGPAGFSSTAQNPVPVATMAHAGFYKVKATLNGCTSVADSTEVIVYPQPYLGGYASPNDTVCEGTVVTFVTVPMNNVINPVYQWFKNGVPVPGANAITLITAYASNDEFYCRSYCEDKCGNTLTLYSNIVHMTVIPVVNDLSVRLSSVPAVALPGNPVTFTANVVSGGYSPQYQWKKNGNDIFGAIYRIYNANNLAPYDQISCCVITSDPCANPTNACSDATVINFPTTVAEVNNESDISFYPNPNDGDFKIKSQKSKIKSIEVVNISGQVVYKLQPEHAQAEYTINLPPQLPTGTYMLRVYDDKQCHNMKFSLAR